MNPIFLLDPPPVQSVSQRQSQKKAATLGVGSYLLSTSPSQRHWNNYYGGGFYRIHTHSVSKQAVYVKFYNNLLGKISILLLFGMHFSSFYFSLTRTFGAQQITF